MSTNVSSVVQHFPEAENGFTTTTAGSVSSGAATVTLNSVAGYTNGEPVVLVIDPTDASKKQTFTGIVDTAGVQITDVVWTAGTNQTHALGATVVDYATATHISMMSKGIKVNHTQKGNHKTLTDDNGNEWIKQTSTASAVNEVTIANAATGTGPTISATGGDNNVDLNLTAKGTGQIKYAGRNDAWNTGVTVPDTVTCNGNRSYDLVINSTDLTGFLSAGMRLRTTRTSAAPTQCTDLESGSSQYYSATSASLAGMTFTDDFTISAWIKVESYTGSAQAIVSRYTGGTGGFIFMLNSSGQLVIYLETGGGATRASTSYQSVPLNKWVHVAGSLNASGASGLLYIDGVLVPSSIAGAATALTQSGNLEIGRYSASNYFDGKIAQLAIYSAVISEANIRATMSQTLSGSETSLVSAYSFNNTILDLNTGNNNDLTANNSAVATNADSPFGGQADGTISSTLDYAEIRSVTFSTNTTVVVQVPFGNTIPTTGGVSAVSYSTQASPYGFPGGTSLLGYSETRANFSTTSASLVDISGLTTTVSVPTGGRDLEVVLSCPAVQHTGTNYSSVAILDGSTVVQNVLINTLASGNIPVTIPVRISGVSSGSHTYKAQLATSAGTVSLLGNVPTSASTVGAISITVKLLP